MTANTISPFSGKPRTRRITGRDGKPEFRIAAAALTPLRAKVADILGGATAAGVFIAAVLGVADMPDPSGVTWLAALVGPWVAQPLFKASWCAALKKQVPMAMSIDSVTVGSFPLAKRFDRSLPHKFALVAHDRIPEEREKHEYEMRKAQLAGKAIRQTRYYAESWHLSYEQLGQRFDLMTIYGRKDARQIRDRLKACDEVLDAEARKSGGTALRPEEQWGEQPGDIPAEP